MFLVQIPTHEIARVSIGEDILTIDLECGCTIVVNTVAISSELKTLSFLSDEESPFCSDKCSWRNAELTEKTP